MNQKAASVLDLRISTEKTIIDWIGTLPIDMKMDLATVIVRKAHGKRFIVWREMKNLEYGRFRFFK